MPSREVRDAFKSQLRATAEFKTTMAKLLQREERRLEAEALRAVCPHPGVFREYWDDPSGNNGGGWECTVCGKDC